MTPRTKAEDLLFKMAINQTWHRNDSSTENQRQRAKQCAIITVEEILSLYKTNWNIDNSYWQSVRDELNNL